MAFSLILRDRFEPRGRWAEWQGGVLGKVKSYDQCQDEIDQRCKELDSDDEEAEFFEAVVREKLRGRFHEPENEFINIPTEVMGVWYGLPEGPHQGQRRNGPVAGDAIEAAEMAKEDTRTFLAMVR